MTPVKTGVNPSVSIPTEKFKFFGIDSSLQLIVLTRKAALGVCLVVQRTPTVEYWYISTSGCEKAGSVDSHPLLLGVYRGIWNR